MPITLTNPVLPYEGAAMKTFELSYEFPLGSGKIVKRDIQAETQEQALRDAGVKNPTLTATEVTRPVVIRTKNGRVKTLKVTDVKKQHPDWIELLRTNYTIRLQAPKHALSSAFDMYELATGEKINETTVGVSEVPEETKRTYSWTILMPKGIADLAPSYLEPKRHVHSDPDTYALYGNALVRELLQDGFRIGTHKVVEVEAATP